MACLSLVLRKLLDFRASASGSIVVAYAIALVPLIGVLGAAVDYSRADRTVANLQAALDSAVLAGAAASTNRDNAALNYFHKNVAFGDGVVSGPTFKLNADGTYSGQVTALMPTTFLGIAGIKSLSVGAKATAALAKVASPGKAMCIIALNLTVAKGIGDSASSAVIAPDCIVQVNSNHSTDAVDLSGSAQIKPAENCFVGKLHTSGSAAVSPAPDAVCKPVADPFANRTKPIVGACDHTKYKPTNNEVLQPGVYCGGLAISSVTVSFAPGLYIIKDGLLQPSGGSKMSGSGVSFFLTGKGAGINTSGGSGWHITAMTTGALKGFVFFLDPTGGPAASSTISGTSELYFDGVIYLPTQLLNLSGGSATFASGLFTAYIADTFTLSGSSNLNIKSDPSKTGVPIPSEILSSSGSSIRLTQ